VQNEFTLRQIVDFGSRASRRRNGRRTCLKSNAERSGSPLRERLEQVEGRAEVRDYTDAVVLSAAQVRTRTGLNPAKVATRMKRL